MTAELHCPECGALATLRRDDDGDELAVCPDENCPRIVVAVISRPSLLPEGAARSVVGDLVAGWPAENFTTRQLESARLYTGGASEIKSMIDAELDRRQRADDQQRAIDENDEQRDYAEERFNAELLREE